MITNLIISILGLYCLGLGINFLLPQNKIYPLAKYLKTIVIGIIFLITAASVLDVAKISLNALMLAKTNLSGLQFIFLLSSVPLIYYILSFFKKKQKPNLTQIISLSIFIFMLVFAFSQPVNQTPSPTIISLSWRSSNNSLELSEIATRYIGSFYSLLNGTKNGNLLNKPMTGSLFIIIFIFGLKIVKSSSKSEFSIKDLLLGGVILSLALIYPSKAIYVLVLWLFLAAINLLFGNKNQSYLVVKGILVALIINPLIWGMLL